MSNSNETENKYTRSGQSKGVFYILLAAFFFSIMSLCVRLSGELPTMQKAFFRNFVAAIFSVIVLSRTPEKFHIKKNSWFGLFMRAGFGTAGLIANFWAIDHLGIADSNMLNKMSPFFAIILSVFVLKEIPRKFEVFCVIIAFTGAAFIIKPTSGIASLPALVGLFGGFGAGTAYTFVRKLGKQGERGPVIVMFFSIFSTCICLPWLIMDFHPMSLKQTCLLLLAGTTACIAQMCITAAYTYAPAKEISVYDYTQVVFATVWGLIFFSEVPDIFSIIGYILIIGIAVIKWKYQNKTGKEKN
ncbi:Permease of the drug/metabolite transporter (DMT) superfamily [Eubacterium ruminantium]|nr:Permease of the drug/metabolite transporter (DMT) superfamily [Eubacterium ruminantium]